MYNKALVALDGSQQAFKALDAAVSLVRQGSVKELGLLYVVSVPHQVVTTDGMSVNFVPEFQEGQNKLAKEVLEKASEKVGDGIKAETIIESGNPADAIIRLAEKNGYDLIVIGNRGLNQLQRIFLGSVSTKVVSNAACSVLVVK